MRDGRWPTARGRVWGVQFHPESICTEWGRRLLANFRDLTLEHCGPGARAVATPLGTAPARKWSPPQRPRLQLQVERIDRVYDPEQVFVNLYGDHRYAFWLDSSKVDERSRFSFMGASGGPLSLGDHLRRGDQARERRPRRRRARSTRSRSSTTSAAR